MAMACHWVSGPTGPRAEKNQIADRMVMTPKVMAPSTQ